MSGEGHLIIIIIVIIIIIIIRSLLAQAQKNSFIKAHERIPLSNQLDGTDGAEFEICLPVAR